MRYKKWFCLIMVMAFMFLGRDAFATQTVRTNVPSFAVTLEGSAFDNAYSRYPLLVYKEMTYIPMTYYDSHLLGLDAKWSEEEGLDIQKDSSAPFYEYMQETVNEKNKVNQQATVAEGMITVNGKTIDNRSEEYPLLVFRNITYFPLTWRFAVDEFGWDYAFETGSGLVIDAPGVHMENPNDSLWQQAQRPHNSSEIGMNGPMKLYFGTYPTTLEEYEEGQKVSLKQLRETGTDRVRIINVYPKAFIEDLNLEYRITKMINGHEQLVYRYILPKLNGEITYAVTCQFAVGYWQNDMAAPGKYRISLVHPEKLSYHFLETDGSYHGGKIVEIGEHREDELVDQGFDPLRQGQSSKLSQDSYWLIVTE